MWYGWPLWENSLLLSLQLQGSTFSWQGFSVLLMDTSAAHVLANTWARTQVLLLKGSFPTPFTTLPPHWQIIYWHKLQNKELQDPWMVHMPCYSLSLFPSARIVPVCWDLYQTAQSLLIWLWGLSVNSACVCVRVLACPVGAHPPSLSVLSVTPATQWDGDIWEADKQEHCSASNWIIHNFAHLIKDEEPAATAGYVTALALYLYNPSPFYWHWIILENYDVVISPGLEWRCVWVGRQWKRECYPFPQEQHYKCTVCKKK